MASKTPSNKFVQCISCKHAEYMQWYENPIIANCGLLRERQVAEANRICRLYAKRTTDIKISHFDHYNH